MEFLEEALEVGKERERYTSRMLPAQIERLNRREKQSLDVQYEFLLRVPCLDTDSFVVRVGECYFCSLNSMVWYGMVWYVI